MVVPFRLVEFILCLNYEETKEFSSAVQSKPIGKNLGIIQIIEFFIYIANLRRLQHMTLSIRPEFLPWIKTADFIARTTGLRMEAVVHDLSDPLHSVIHVANGSVTDRHVGQGLRHLVVEMLTADDQNSDTLPVWWFRYKNKLIRCVTQLIRDSEGHVTGALCLNEDVTEELRIFESLKGRLPGVRIELPNEEGEIVGLADRSTRGEGGLMTKSVESVRDTVFRLIASLAAREDEPKLKKDPRSRRAFIRELDERGVFLVKGSIEYAAQLLGVAKVTVYSDLDALHRESRKK